MMLASKFNGHEVSGWLMSEKLDGVRAFWDGRFLRTRSWAVIHAPLRITAGLPVGVAMDGELWAGRGTFEQVRVAVQHKGPDAPEWIGVRFMVFDSPSVSAVPLETRLRMAEKLANAAGVGFVPQTRCEGSSHAIAEMQRIVAAGGEGVVLRRPGSCYTFGRSTDWLKLKAPGVD